MGSLPLSAALYHLHRQTPHQPCHIPPAKPPSTDSPRCPATSATSQGSPRALLPRKTLSSSSSTPRMNTPTALSRFQTSSPPDRPSLLSSTSPRVLQCSLPTLPSLMSLKSSSQRAVATRRSSTRSSLALSTRL